MSPGFWNSRWAAVRLVVALAWTIRAPPRTPTGIELEAGLDPLEKNGFSIIDFTEDRIEGQMFNWKMGEPVEHLDNLQPFHRFTAVRGA